MITKNFWKGKKVFLTGCTGFKGSWLSIWLHELGSTVKGYSLPPPTQPSLFEMAEIDRLIDLELGDITDGEKLKSSLVKFQPDIVIHMAAQPLVRQSYLDPVNTYNVNVMGTIHLFEAVRNSSSVKAVVNVTTDKCYENKEWHWGYRENEPMGGYDPYSNSKGCSELVTSSYRSSFFNANDYGIKHNVGLASARAGNVIGGGDFAKDRLIPDIVEAISSGNLVKIRSPLSIRPWQHVLEPLSGYLTLAEALYQHGPKYAEGWNFGPNDEDSRTVEWIVKKMCDLWPNSRGYEVITLPQPHEAAFLKLDISKAKNKLNWSPKWNLEKTLESIIKWNYEKGNKLSLCLKQINERNSF